MCLNFSLLHNLVIFAAHAITQTPCCNADKKRFAARDEATIYPLRHIALRSLHYFHHLFIHGTSRRSGVEWSFLDYSIVYLHQCRCQKFFAREYGTDALFLFYCWRERLHHSKTGV